MGAWIVKVAAPFWAVMYIVIFYVFGVTIFVSAEMLWGMFLAVLILTVLFGTWGVIFYLILLQSSSFDHLKDYIGNFLKDKHGKVFDWIRTKYFDEGNKSGISPILIMLVFLVQNPLLAVPLIRYSFPKNAFWKGFLWVWVGSIIKVLTWYLPLYGGGLTLLHAVLRWFNLG